MNIILYTQKNGKWLLHCNSQIRQSCNSVSPSAHCPPEARTAHYPCPSLRHQPLHVAAGAATASPLLSSATIPIYLLCSSEPDYAAVKKKTWPEWNRSR
ncbi:hypothetical protein BDA96_09G152000 [Sorghum bicolor]|uniref:Uncharacterized protein n=2 Tax=Sorghum bicolor TaxID=4558 RepID=A0A921QD64_SORBI|nr:hypothetical protein BDA96_09G152000 [Sorghum bicolor]KXG22041.1 hypothetical protein SORBI_3009G144400 [Sorghum bicolor]